MEYIWIIIMISALLYFIFDIKLSSILNAAILICVIIAIGFFIGLGIHLAKLLFT